jgi:restriction endonuclease S subunit
MKVERIAETEDYITELGLSAGACHPILPGSILVVVRSGILQHTIPVAINDVLVVVNQDMKALLPLGSVCPEYVYYFIQGTQRDLRDEWVKQGATVESIEYDRMLDTKIPLPTKHEQLAISSYLSQAVNRLNTLSTKTEQSISLLRERRSALITAAVTGRIDIRQVLPELVD